MTPTQLCETPQALDSIAIDQPSCVRPTPARSHRANSAAPPQPAGFSLNPRLDPAISALSPPPLTRQCFTSTPWTSRRPPVVIGARKALLFQSRKNLQNKPLLLVEVLRILVAQKRPTAARIDELQEDALLVEGLFGVVEALEHAAGLPRVLSHVRLEVETGADHY